MSARVIRATIAAVLAASALLVTTSEYLRANEPGPCPCRTEGNTPGYRYDQQGSVVCVEC
jgi:hypothetical protein